MYEYVYINQIDELQYINNDSHKLMIGISMTYDT